MSKKIKKDDSVDKFINDINEWAKTITNDDNDAPYDGAPVVPILKYDNEGNLLSVTFDIPIDLQEED